LAQLLEQDAAEWRVRGGSPNWLDDHGDATVFVLRFFFFFANLLDCPTGTFSQKKKSQTSQRKCFLFKHGATFKKFNSVPFSVKQERQKIVTFQNYFEKTEPYFPKLFSARNFLLLASSSFPWSIDHSFHRVCLN